MLLITSALVAVVSHLHADRLSAEEQQLVGTWRRFDADGKHVRDERYFADRSVLVDSRVSTVLPPGVESLRPMGGNDAQMDLCYTVLLSRWSFSDGEIRIRRPISFDECADKWSGGRYVYIGDFAFPRTSRRRSTCKTAIYLSGVEYHNYASISAEYPQAVFGESIRDMSDGQVHTLRRLLSEKLPNSKNRVVE